MTKQERDELRKEAERNPIHGTCLIPVPKKTFLALLDELDKKDEAIRDAVEMLDDSNLVDQAIDTLVGALEAK